MTGERLCQAANCCGGGGTLNPVRNAPAFEGGLGLSGEGMSRLGLRGIVGVLAVLLRGSRHCCGGTGSRRIPIPVILSGIVRDWQECGTSNFD